MYEKFLQWIENAGFTALGRFLPFVLILVVGIILIRVVGIIMKRALGKSKVDKAAHGMLCGMVKIVMIMLLGMMCAGTLGIDISGILAFASVATLAISLALQDLLSNLVGGFTLLYTDPFDAGHFVEIAGQSGTVKEIGMTYTKLLTADNKLVQIPNSSVVSSEIINYTVTGKRRVDIAASASYNAPVDLVLEALQEAANVEGILEEHGIYAGVTGYGANEIEYVIRVWAATDNYWTVHNTILYNVKKVFDAKGIAMDYPHLMVHLDKQSEEQVNNRKQDNAGQA